MVIADLAAKRWLNGSTMLKHSVLTIALTIFSSLHVPLTCSTFIWHPSTSDNLRHCLSPLIVACSFLSALWRLPFTIGPPSSSALTFCDSRLFSSSPCNLANKSGLMWRFGHLPVAWNALSDTHSCWLAQISTRNSLPIFDMCHIAADSATPTLGLLCVTFDINRSSLFLGRRHNQHASANLLLWLTLPLHDLHGSTSLLLSFHPSLCPHHRRTCTNAPAVHLCA